MGESKSFPLLMSDRTEVWTMRDFVANYSDEKVLGYYLNGSLKLWLRDRGYHDLLEEIDALDSSSDGFSTELAALIKRA